MTFIFPINSIRVNAARSDISYKEPDHDGGTEGSYVYKETLFYTPPFHERSRYDLYKYKKIMLYRYEKDNEPIITSWRKTYISPRVDFVPGISVSVSKSSTATYTFEVTKSGSIEFAIIKDILKVGGSVSTTKSYSYSDFSAFDITIDYETAKQIFGPQYWEYSEFIIVHKQAYGSYYSQDYEGYEEYWHYTIFHSAEDAIKTWSYTSMTMYEAPLSGYYYQKITVEGIK